MLMTITLILTQEHLEALINPELDALAKALLGCQRIRDQAEDAGMWEDDDALALWDWSPATDGSAMLVLIDELIKQRFELKMDSPILDDHQWTFRVWEPNRIAAAFVVECNSLPRAVTIAFILTMQKLQKPDVPGPHP